MCMYKYAARQRRVENVTAAKNTQATRSLGSCFPCGPCRFKGVSMDLRIPRVEAG
jgi:hypothetical protein